jgi:type I restriction enzyme, S subunit
MKRLNKIEKLITELCPNGVEFKELGELGDFYSGLTGKSKDDFNNGNSKFIAYMNIFSNIAVDTDVDIFVKIKPNEKQNKIQFGDILFTGSSETPNDCGMSSVLTKKTDESLYLNSFCFGFRFYNTNLLLPEFSKYLFRDEQIRKQIEKTASGVTRFNISKKRFAKIKIPLPPLPIQQEIVKILDSFTELEAWLEAELEAELEARKKQYEYYRDELLTFGDGVEFKELGEVCKFKRGNTITKKTSIDGNIPVIAGGQKPAYYHNIANRANETIAVSGSGAYAGFVSHWTTPVFLSDSFSVEPNNQLIIKYVYFFLKHNQEKIYNTKKGSGVPHVHGSSISKIKIPIPSLTEQKRIVSILDKFDALVNGDTGSESSMTGSLPAELKARRQQYEYYRGKLLTFTPLDK